MDGMKLAYLNRILNDSWEGRRNSILLVYVGKGKELFWYLLRLTS